MLLECSSSSSIQKRRRPKKKKKKKGEDDENVDMMSDLPEPLLHHIFSFLDIKQAIHTCILSKRWKKFWVSLPTLNFNYSRGGKGYLKIKTNDKSKYMDFVDQVLLLHESSNIQKLAVVVKGRYDITDRLDTWIRISVIRNIQQLSLQIYKTSSSIRTCEFLHCLSNCKSLTKLELVVLYYYPYHHSITLDGPDSFTTLPSLKSLSIQNVRFGDKFSIDGFFSQRCLPVLETLILIDVCSSFGSLQTLNISSLKLLKHLKLEGWDRSHSRSSVDIHLDAPNLISFYCKDSIFKHWIIQNLTSLVKADINNVDKWLTVVDSPPPKICYAQPTAIILRELHNVEELTLSFNFFDDNDKIFTEALESFDNHSMLFLKLKCLKLEGADLSVELFRVMAYLLNACPYIVTLCLWVPCWDYLTCKCRYCNEANSSLANQGDSWGARLSLECLKIIEFRNVKACVNELKFIENLLNESVVLEKLFIVFSIGKRLSEDDKRCRVKFREKVLTFPRVSSRVAILFK